MKMTIAGRPLYVLLLVMLLISGAIASAQKVDLVQKDMPLASALKAISDQTGYKFLYTEQMLSRSNPVSLRLVKASLDDALAACLVNQQLTYSIKEKTVILARKPAPAPSKPITQDITIRGIVRDDKGKVMEGVSIFIKGAKTGVMTSALGAYEISAGAKDVLVFSYTGYDTREIQIKGNANIDVILSPSNVNLQDIVIVGYGTQKKSDVTGAIVTVKGSETVNQPARSVSDLLQARAAGVEVVKNSADPAGNTSIYIRGASSLNNPPPLYVVDGVPQGNTGNNFNTQDIESIEVLKDASASSIYGAAASGGVILVTTKRGAANKKPLVSFNGYAGTTKAILPRLLDRDGFIKAYANIGQDVTFGANASTLPNTDWAGALFRKGNIQNYDVSVAGGGNNSNFYVSGNYNSQLGNVIENYFKRYSFRVNSDHRINKMLKLGESIQIWKSSQRPLVHYGGAYNSGEFPYRSRPTMAIYDSTNISGGGWGKNPPGYYGANPVGIERSYQILDESSAVEGNAYVTITPVKGLDIRGVVGYLNQYEFNTQYIALYNFGPVQNTNPSLTKTANGKLGLTTTGTINYSHSFGKHNLTALAGYEQRSQNISTLGGTADSLALPNVTNFFVTSNVNQFVNGGIYKGLIKSYFGRLSYNYAGKYSLEISARRDGDFYHFGSQHQYGSFPAASAAWNIGQEKFIKDHFSQISFLKLRGGYGSFGNNNIPAYLFSQQYVTTGGYTFTDNGTKALSSGVLGIANQNIKWETTKESSVGIDLGLLQNRLQFSVDYYHKLTDGILYDLTLPLSAGYSLPLTTNIGKIRNRGFEFMVSWQNSMKDFSYSISANASLNRNTVLQLDATTNNPIYAGYNSVDGGVGISGTQSISRSAVGHSLGEFYGLIATGVYQTDDQAAKGPKLNNVNPSAGDLIFKDRDGNGLINDADRDYMGNPNPTLVYGFNIAFTYKWVDLSALFQGAAGGQLYNGRQAYNQYIYSDFNTTADVFGTSFFGDNGVTGQPRTGKKTGGAYLPDPYGNYSNVSSWWVQSGSYLKLQNLQIGFSLPKQVLGRIGMASARLFFMGSNVFSITGYKGPDPQVQAADVKSRGIDVATTYPQNRMYAIGLNCSF